MKLHGSAILARAQERPGGAHAARLPGTPMLVGGAVRDLALGREPQELDLTVEVPAVEAATAFAGMLEADGEGPCEVREHPRFSTARVDWPAGTIDIAQRRAETYSHPGALPDVMPAGLEQDLRRRDFTVNAIAVALEGEERGSIFAAPHALADLDRGQMRVLHAASFEDDPTRLLRLVRYTARLGFEIERSTRSHVDSAIANSALGTVSPARTGAELRLLIAEPDPLRALSDGEELGLWATIDAGMSFNAERAAAALAELAEDGRAEIVLAACLLEGSASRARALLDSFEFAGAERDQILRALRAGEVREQLGHAERDSQIVEILDGAGPEAAALAAAHGDERTVAAVSRWRETLRGVELSIGARDLLAAGVPQGPQIGRRLAATRARLIDGEIRAGRDSELAAALEGRV